MKNEPDSRGSMPGHDSRCAALPGAGGSGIVAADFN